jgi:hypothetical protein
MTPQQVGLLSAAIPSPFGDALGLLADAAGYAQDPSSLTPGRGLLSLAGLLPGIPGAAAREGAQSASKLLGGRKLSIRINNKPVSVLQNPTPEEIGVFRQSIRANLLDRGMNPSAGPLTRQTKDEFGNTWIWDADASIHEWMEAELSKLVGGRPLSQSSLWGP